MPSDGISCATRIGMENKPRFDARLEEGIAYFEEMLRLMPEDRTTLEFLVVAYDQLGDREKGEKSLVSLVNLLIKQNDLTAAEALLPRLKSAECPEAKVLELKVKRLVAPPPELTPEKPHILTETEILGEKLKVASKGEVALVDELVKGGVLSENDAASLRKQVSELSTESRAFLISALSILEKENVDQVEKCLAFLADKCALAPIPLAAFEPNPELVKGFSAETLRLRGAVPFAKIGSMSLVALLNPLDDQLIAELSSATKCRFFLALPSAVEAHLSKLFGEEVHG